MHQDKYFDYEIFDKEGFKIFFPENKIEWNEAEAFEAWEVLRNQIPTLPEILASDQFTGGFKYCDNSYLCFHDGDHYYICRKEVKTNNESKSNKI